MCQLLVPHYSSLSRKHYNIMNLITQQTKSCNCLETRSFWVLVSNMQHYCKIWHVWHVLSVPVKNWYGWQASPSTHKARWCFTQNVKFRWQINNWVESAMASSTHFVMINRACTDDWTLPWLRSLSSQVYQAEATSGTKLKTLNKWESTQISVWFRMTKPWDFPEPRKTCLSTSLPFPNTSLPYPIKMFGFSNNSILKGGPPPPFFHNPNETETGCATFLFELTNSTLRMPLNQSQSIC